MNSILFPAPVRPVLLAGRQIGVAPSLFWAKAHAQALGCDISMAHEVGEPCAARTAHVVVETPREFRVEARAGR